MTAITKQERKARQMMSKANDRMVYWLIVQYLTRKAPRPGWFGKVLRYFHLPWGWIGQGIDDEEFEALTKLAKQWDIYQ